MYQRVDRPVVEYCRSSVSSAESLFVHSSLSIFLSGIKHERVGSHKCACHESRYAFPGVAGKEVACYSLLVMVFQEIEHVVGDVVIRLPLSRDISGAPVAAYHATHAVIHSHLVVEIVKTGIYIFSVSAGIVYLANEFHVVMFFSHFRRDPLPES